MFSLPDLSQIFVKKSLKDEVHKIWRNNPDEELNVENIILQLKKQNKGHLVENKEYVKTVFEMLKEEKFINNLKEEITDLWWRNPRDELTVDGIIMQLREQDKNHLTVNRKDVENVFKSLDEENYINKNLDNLFFPRRTKLEYFWLLMMNLALNLLALIGKLYSLRNFQSSHASLA